MRLAGYAAVVLSALLGVGGVSLRSQADPVETSSDPVGGMSLLIENGESASACFSTPTHQRRVLRLPNRPADDLRFTLNVNGHNYVRPGEYRPMTPVNVVPAAPSE